MEESISVEVGIKEVSFSGQIVHCGCGDWQSHYGAVCPQGVVEDLGVLGTSEEKS